jgi:hypothetical protein
MYTIYRNYKQLIRHLKHTKQVVIHDSILPIANKIEGLRGISMILEALPSGQVVRVMRYTPPQRPLLGTVQLPKGGVYPVVGVKASPHTGINYLMIDLGQDRIIYRNQEQVEMYTAKWDTQVAA